MKKGQVIYQLTIENIQKVAEENFVRKLTSKEIKKIIDPIADSIEWYDIILDAIRDNLNIEELNVFDEYYS